MQSAFDKYDIQYVTERWGAPIAGVPCPIMKETGKINPHATIFKFKNGDFRTVFHIKPIYYETVQHTWRPMYEVCSHYGNKRVVFKYESLFKVHPRFLSWLEKRMELIGGQILVTSPLGLESRQLSNLEINLHEVLTVPRIGLTVTTVYPDPHVETTTVDGYISLTNQTTWAGVRDAANGSTVDDSGGASLLIIGGRTQTSSDYDMWRGYAGFDTSAVGSDTVSDVTLSLYCPDTTLNWDTQNGDIDVVGVTLASNTALAVGDYDGVDTTVQGSFDITSIVNATYSDFTGTTGYINGSGVTNYGFRESGDTDNNEWSVNTTGSRARFDTADVTGTSQDPKLVVTHAAAAGGSTTGNLLLIGVG